MQKTNPILTSTNGLIKTLEKIKKIASTDNTNIDIFKNTPIYNLLQNRRIIAKNILSNDNSKNSQELLILLNNKLKKFFLI